MELPVDEMDISLFNASTCVLVKNSRKAFSGILAG
jgi:hypothetical protein